MKTNKLLLVFIGILASVGSSSGEGKVSNYFVNSIDSGDQTRFRRNADPLSDKLSDQHIQFTSSSTSNQTRFKRNADPLSDYSGKLSTVARISNGISLLAGLINKNIPIDTVIQELLHFGNVKLTDVVALQKDKVEAALKELEVAPTSLAGEMAIKNLESEIIGWSKLKVYLQSTEDLSQISLPTSYFDKADNFNQDQTNWTVLTSMSTEITTVLGFIENIEQAPEVAPNTFGRTASDIREVDDRLKILQDNVAKFQTIIQTIDSFGDLADPDNSFKKLIQLLEVCEIRRNIPDAGPSNAPELIANMKVVNSLSTSLDAARTDLARVDSLMAVLHKPTRSKRQYVSAFPNGASDLKKLSADIRDSSFLQSMGDGKNFARLSGGLKPLEEFAKKLGVVEDKLKPIITPAVLRSTSSALTLQTSVAAVNVDSTVVTKSFDELYKCAFQVVQESSTKHISDLIIVTHGLADQLKNLKSVAQLLTQLPPEMENVKKIVSSLSENTLKESEVKQLLSDWKAAKSDVQKVVGYLNKVKDTLATAPSGDDAKKTAGEVGAKRQEVDFFLKNAFITTAMSKLNCIRDVNGPIDKIAQNSQASQLIRNFKSDDIKNIRSAVDIISQASDIIKDLQKIPGNRKKRQTDEVKELVKFKDSQKTSATLGSAAVTINSMKQLKGLESTAVKAIRTPTVFDTELGKTQDQKKKSEILKKWGDHTAFLASLDTTLGQIKDFESKLKVAKDLRKLGAHLNDAKAVADVTQNIADKSEAVDLLILETSDAKAKAELEALKTQLDTLAALDLQFSSHHSAFPWVSDAMKSFFDFLSEFLDPSSKPSAETAAAAAAAADSGTSIWLYVGIGVGVVALIVGIGILIFCLLKRNKKNKSEVSKKSEKDKKDKEKKGKDDNDKSSQLRETSGKEEFVTAF